MVSPAQPKFNGTHEHSLDKQGRLTVPLAWRTGVAEDAEFMVIPQPGGYLAVLPPSEVEKINARAAAVPLNDEIGQEDLATFFSSVQTITFDKQGRFTLASHLKAYAGITDDVVLMGTLSKFNIYSSTAWSERQARKPANLGDTMRRLGF